MTLDTLLADMDIITFFIGAAAMLATLASAIIIVHPRIHEGLLIKLGLITLSLGGFALVNHLHVLEHVDDRPLGYALASCSAGMLMVIGGAAWRILRCPQGREVIKVASGWAELDEAPDQDEIHQGK